MMLKPFRIRNLYGSNYGVVQITAAQYNSTIISQPDAVLTYLDDDDGEVVTVGSSLELIQRLDEPVLVLHQQQQQQQQQEQQQEQPNGQWFGAVDPQQFAARGSDSSPVVMPTALHTFDIQHTSGSLATWREHEAYSSKAFRKSLPSAS